nr:uncharacterized protein LOC110373173 [Helicoverpa armigera]
MVSNYKRKTNRGDWTQKNLERAMEEASRTSVRAAAKKYNIPFSTLLRHCKTRSTSKHLGRFKPIFTADEENTLKKYLTTMDDLFYGLTPTDFKKLVGEFAQKLGKGDRFPKGCAGKDWLSGFRKRHTSIVLRTPEPTSLARARGFNRPQVERFYDLLEELIDKHSLDPTQIYNMDETGIRSSTTRPPKILSTYGKRQVGLISSVERGVLTTVVCCCNAAGSFLPPFFIFKRKRFVPRLLDGAPPGSQGTVSDSGWISGPIFLNWLEFLVEKTRPTEQKKLLLLLDNHESHKYYPALEYATKHHIIFLSFPPHTTNKLQPLDVAVYGPIKKYFEQEIATFHKAHPGRTIAQLDVASIFNPAYLKGATPVNSISGFRTTGICPYNRNLFQECDFAPASVTDQPQMDDTNGLQINRDPLTAMSSTSLEVPTHKTPPLSPSMSVASTVAMPDSQTSAEVVLKSIRPIPTAVGQKMTTRKRKSQKAEILTSTPVKVDQNQRFQKAEQRAVKNLGKENLLSSTNYQTPSTSRMKQKKSVRGAAKTVRDYYCTVCKEQFVHPPAEDWIQCSQCKDWTHEACSAYLGRGTYFCDDCQDI